MVALGKTRRRTPARTLAQSAQGGSALLRAVTCPNAREVFYNSLEIKNLPAAPAAPDTLPLVMEPDTPTGRSAAKRRQAAPSLFEIGGGQ